MYITKIYRDSEGSVAETTRFLQEGHSTLKKLIQLHDFLEASQTFSPIEIPKGFSVGELLASNLEDLEIIPFICDYFSENLVTCRFGTGPELMRMKRAMTYLPAIQFETDTILRTMKFPTSDQVEELLVQTRYAIGNLLYGWTATIDMPAILQYADAGVEIQLHPTLQNWANANNVNVLDTCRALQLEKRRFVPILEALVDAPEQWDRFIALVPEHLREDAINNAQSVMLCDIDAAVNGQITVDEDYIQLLIARSEDEDSPLNQNPDMVADFIKQIPLAYAHIMVTYARQIDANMMHEVVRFGKKIDAGFVQKLEQLKTPEGKTSAFRGLGGVSNG